jgi:EpsI family protein
MGLVWLILGTRHLKILFVPVGYLFFMFYLMEELLGRFSYHLQTASAWIAANLLSATGMPVFLHGHLLALPHISLEVAQVCNGVNHIVALAAMSVPFAFLSQQSVLKKCLIVVGAFLVGLFSNGLRVALIGYWTKFYPEGPLHGPFDIFYVSFILIFGLAFFGLPAVLSNQWEKRQGSPRATSQSQVREPSREAWVGTRKQWVAVSAALGILFVANANIYLHSPIPVEPKRDLSQFPMQIGQWEGKDVTDPEWPAKNLVADQQLRRVYRHPSGDEVGVYIGYFRTQQQGKELIDHRLGWLHLKEEPVFVAQGARGTEIRKGVARGLREQTYEGDRRAFYFWYHMDGRIYLNRHQAKIALMLKNLLTRHSNGALVLVSTENSENSDSVPSAISGFLQAIVEISSSYL